MTKYNDSSAASASVQRLTKLVGKVNKAFNRVADKDGLAVSVNVLMGQRADGPARPSLHITVAQPVYRGDGGKPYANEAADERPRLVKD